MHLSPRSAEEVVLLGTWGDYAIQTLPYVKYVSDPEWYINMILGSWGDGSGSYVIFIPSDHSVVIELSHPAEVQQHRVIPQDGPLAFGMYP